MPELRHVVVVCGYGCHLDTPLRPYLDRVVRFIKEQKPGGVIFCGGYTQKKSAPSVSEAKLMSGHVGSQLSASWVYALEDDSYTTYENIQKAAVIIRALWHGGPTHNRDHITIFCEAQKAPVVLMLARHFMGNLVSNVDGITVETHSWERQDPFKQWWKIVSNHIAITFPFIARWERRKRLLRSEHI